MKFSLCIGCCALAALLTVAGGATTLRVPLLLYNGDENYYRYTADIPTQNRKQETDNSSKLVASPEPYQKYIACVSRTFLFEGCTLCYCTDMPNVALCWNYDSDKCTQTRRLVDEQKNATHNNPNGVW